jgi:hypothetical protein
MITETLFAQFQHHLTTLGGEVVCVDDLAQAAQIIVERAKQGDGSIVVPPMSGSSAAGAETPLWQQILPVLRDKGITIKESSGPDSGADAPIGFSGAALAIAALYLLCHRAQPHIRYRARPHDRRAGPTSVVRHRFERIT